MGTWSNLIGYLSTILRPVYGRITSLLRDKSLFIIVLTLITFSNFFVTLYASIRERSGGLLLEAFNALWLTLGQSVQQMIVGLSTIYSRGLAFKSVTAALTFLAGVTTVYWWYKANGFFVRFMESTNPTVVHYVYMTLIFVLAVWVSQGQEQFFELMDLTREGLDQAAGLSDFPENDTANHSINKTG